MSQLLSVATAVPLFAVSQNEAIAAARVIFAGRIPHLERLLTVFSNTGIERRYFAVPLDWFREPHSPEQVNRTFIETATELSAHAIRKALDHCSLQPIDSRLPGLREYYRPGDAFDRRPVDQLAGLPDDRFANADSGPGLRGRRKRVWRI